MLPFRFRLKDGLPVSEQLVRAAKRAILNQELEGGTIFPSVRSMAQELKISPTTVHKAILELKESGYIVSRPGIGMVVIDQDKLGKNELKEQLREQCLKLWQEARFLGLGQKELTQIFKQIEHEQDDE